MPVCFSIPERRGKGKINVSEKRKAVEAMMEQYEKGRDEDARIALIQELIPAGLQAVAEQLQAEVKTLAGKKHAHGKENGPWGKQGGSAYLRDQKFPITVPRVRNKKYNVEVPLKTYQRLQEPYRNDDQVILKLLNGISTRRYRKCAELVPEVFGISPSTLSKRFKANTAQAIKKLMNRSLQQHDFICIFVV